jgi:hypothetical protein
VITPPAGLRIYLACGVTDMRKGMVGLAMLVQQGLAEDPFGGAVYAFRGRRAGLIKLLSDDHDDRLHHPVDAAVGSAARRLRMACPGAAPQAGAGGVTALRFAQKL